MIRNSDDRPAGIRGGGVSRVRENVKIKKKKNNRKQLKTYTEYFVVNQIRRARQTVSAFSTTEHERMLGGAPAAACVMSTRASAQSLPTTAAAAATAITTPQSAVRRSGDFMACTVITLWVYRTNATAAEARSQVSDSDCNFFCLLVPYPPARQPRTPIRHNA